MSNLFTCAEPKDFWVWVNPQNWLVRHQIQVVGSFFSGGLLPAQGKSNLMFIPNPDFEGDVTPFQHGVMREYMAEYNLEMGRVFHKFDAYPSRLNAIYLFESEDEAHKYKVRHLAHVSDRVLKKGYSATECIYSVHDSSWVDFLRLSHMIEPKSINSISQSYWRGLKVEETQLESLGEPWTKTPIMEVLFIGRLNFYDRQLDC
jgi:hypothetical protein